MGSPKSLRNFAVIAAIGLLAAAMTWYLRGPSRSAESPGVSAGLSASGSSVGRPDSAAREGTASAASVPATLPEPGSGNHHLYVRAVVDELMTRTDAQSLATAALLMQSDVPDFTQGGSREAWVRRLADVAKRAAAAAPNDVAIQFIALMFCPASDAAVTGCDPAPYESAVAMLDATNARTADSDLRRALDGQDAAGQAAVLARMASASRFESYRSEIGDLVDRAIQLAAPSLASEDSEQLLANAMAHLPAGTPPALTEACVPPSEDSIRDCQAVANLMLDSREDTIVRGGLELAGALVVPGSPEATKIAETQRQYDWQMYHSTRLPRSPEQNARILKGLLGDARLRRELLLENGISLEPPAEWKPPSAPPE
jgi:hypothetical protein